MGKKGIAERVQGRKFERGVTGRWADREGRVVLGVGQWRGR